MQDQVPDSMDLKRERSIAIKVSGRGSSFSWRLATSVDVDMYDLAAFPVTDSVTELESENVIAIHPDDFEEGLAPARDSAEVFLAQCQNRALSQEYGVKAMGIVTFAASIFVFGTDWEARTQA